MPPVRASRLTSRPPHLRRMASKSAPSGNASTLAGQVAVCRAVLADEATDGGHHVVEVQPEERAHQPFRLREFQYEQTAVRAQHTHHPPHALFEVLEVAHTKGHGDRIERRIGKWQVGGIGLNELDPSIEASVPHFLAAVLQHTCGDIRAGYLRHHCRGEQRPGRPCRWPHPACAARVRRTSGGSPCARQR